MEAGSIIGALGALIFVLALILGAAWAAKRFRYNGSILKTNKGSARLKIVERVQLDGRHQAVLLSCDEAEHLVVLSPEDATALSHEARPS